MYPYNEIILLLDSRIFLYRLKMKNKKLYHETKTATARVL